MPEIGAMNPRIIEEYRANDGRMSGHFAGLSMVLVHHTGRKSGAQRVNPMLCLPDEKDDDTVYVFATNAGRASNPAWYYNVVAAGETTIERDGETFAVTVRELAGDERNRTYAAQARHYPAYLDYARQTADVRIIPVLELTRVQSQVRR